VGSIGVLPCKWVLDATYKGLGAAQMPFSVLYKKGLRYRESALKRLERLPIRLLSRHLVLSQRGLGLPISYLYQEL